jgi:6-pyruvoyltetrahydropterin/6-carboxytetrahydropterin synthase
MNTESNSSVTIMKRITFCAGHRLLNHGGKCENLHGHNYVAEIFVTGDKTDNVGRLVDFSVINSLFSSWINEHWDHAMLLWDVDTTAISALQSVEPNRIYLLPWNPTAENMGRYLLERAGPQLLSQIADYQLQVSKVVLWETGTSCAEVALSDGKRRTDWNDRPAWQQTFAG